MKKVGKRGWNSKEGEEVEVVKYVYGNKLLVLLEARHKIVVAARVVKINEHEKKFTKELIKEALHRTGGKMKVLLIDRGFIDRVLLWWLWEKADRHNIFLEQTKEMKVRGLLSYDQFGDEEHRRRKGRKNFKANPINGVMVIRWDGKDYEPRKDLLDQSAYFWTYKNYRSIRSVFRD